MRRSCKEHPYLSQLLDGELSETKAMEVRSHLETCERCQQAFAELTRLDSLLKTLPEIDLSPDFDKAFDKRLRNEPAAPYYQRLFGRLRDYFFGLGFKPRLAAAVIVILIIAAAVLNPLSSEPTLEERFMAENLDFFDTLDMIDQLDLFTNWDAITKMDENT